MWLDHAVGLNIYILYAVLYSKCVSNHITCEPQLLLFFALTFVAKVSVPYNKL